MFVADDISPAHEAEMVAREHASPATGSTPGGRTSWATTTWLFDIGAERTSPVARVRSALADLTADLNRLTRGTELAALLTELELITRSVEAATVKVMARADRADAFRDDGHGTLAGWVRSIIKWSPSEASARARTALTAHSYPALVERLDAGTLGVAQARRLAGLHANRRVRDELPIVFDTLADIAGALPYEDFNTAVLRLEQLADAERLRAPSSSRSSSVTWKPNCATTSRPATLWASPPCPICPVRRPNGAPMRCTPSSAVPPWARHPHPSRS